MGSVLPGGYSTVIIRPSLPGRFVRSFEMSCVTLASHAISVPEMRHTNAKIRFVNVINLTFRLTDAIRCVACVGGHFAVMRSAARVPVRHAANLRCGGRPAGHVIRTD